MSIRFYIQISNSNTCYWNPARQTSLHLRRPTFILWSLRLWVWCRGYERSISGAENGAERTENQLSENGARSDDHRNTSRFERWTATLPLLLHSHATLLSNAMMRFDVERAKHLSGRVHHNGDKQLSQIQ